MQRLLKDSGTSFRRLLDEVRNEHARGYLGSTTFSDGEVLSAWLRRSELLLSCVSRVEWDVTE
jgi:hypothetical protein